MQVRRLPIRRSSPRLRSVQLFALTVMLLCAMATLAVSASPAFGARRLEVYGAHFTDDLAVRQIVGMEGSPNLFRLDTDRIAEELVKLPAVESARVEVRLPDTVVVTVVEREPKLIWVVGDRRYAVDEGGLLFALVDSVGNPLPSSPGAGETAQPSAEPSGASTAASAEASAAATSTVTPGHGAESTPKATPKATPKGSPSPGRSPSASPSASSDLAASASPTSSPLPPPSLMPVPTPDPATTAGPQVVSLPVVYDRRAADVGLTLGGVVDPIALDAGYRLAGLTPADVGSELASLDVVVDDDHGFTLSSGPGNWVADFGFYTETLRKDTVIPEQVRDLRSMLLHYGEDHVAWVFLVADIAGNRLNTYIAK
jgi:hypothetical protein